MGQGRLIRRQENRGQVNQMMTPINPLRGGYPRPTSAFLDSRLDPGQDLTHTPGSKTKDTKITYREVRTLC